MLPLGALCNTFDLQYAIIGLEKQIFGIYESCNFTQVLLQKTNEKVLEDKTYFIMKITKTRSTNYMQ